MVSDLADFARGLKSGLMRGAKKFSRDQGGNVLLMTAAAIVPIVAIVGSAVDIGRAYMANLRLQQACDAGVLAGRRAMGGTVYNDDHQADALSMFSFNFPDDTYGSTDISFTSSPGGGADVSGQASATLPTSIMKFFGFEDFDLSVNCGAKMEIANTDVMMVLDVTGSMVQSGSTKLSDLKREAKAFLTTLMSADVGDGRIRVGVVPYALTVNVGQILIDQNPSWIAGNFEIPSMVYVERRGTTTYVNGRCLRYSTGRNPRCEEYEQVAQTTYKDVYRKKNISYDVSPLKLAGSSSGTFASSNFPIGKRGGNVGITWDGCITEVQTTATDRTGSFDLDDAWDMDINHEPGTDEAGKWKMYLPRLAFDRSSTAEVEVVLNDNANLNSSTRSVHEEAGHDVGCPVAAMPLTVMTSDGQDDFEAKIDSLAGHGYTYHDAGMAWGGRLVSPRGIMRNENATALNGKPISRHIIFMTDGNMDTDRGRYSHQGLELPMPRVGSTSKSDSNARHINRFKRLCSYIKAEGVTIWVIAFGFPPERDRDSEEITNFANLTECASPGLMYDADDGEALGEVFQTIAGQISRLRVSQ